MKEKPNILWICTDQQRFDTLGCTGNEWVRTPNLDRLAADGMLFRNCFTQSPVCAPSRAAFLTGRYPVTCGCRQNGQDIPDTEIPVPRILADHGYRCGLAGKLHISACNPSLNRNAEPRIDDGYSDFHWSHHDGGGWGLNNEYWRWLAEHGREYVTIPHPDCRFVEYGMPEEFRQTAWCVGKAAEFITDRAADRQPWLFSVNLFDPHHAFNPPREALERFLPVLDRIPLPDYVPGELDNKPVWQRTDHAGAYSGRAGFEFDDMSSADHRWIKAAYWAMVEVIDRQLGRLFEVLKQTGQEEDTIIIFTSDHGEMLGDHGIYLKGPYFYDCLTRVPLVIAGKGISRGVRNDALVELFDLAPTILDLCGIEIPERMQAKSFFPLLTGKETILRESVYCEFYGANFRYDPHAFTTMVRTGKHKLSVAHRTGCGELYDLDADPGEHRNLWDDPEYAAKKTELLVALCDRMAGTADPLPSRQAMW